MNNEHKLLVEIKQNPGGTYLNVFAWKWGTGPLKLLKDRSLYIKKKNSLTLFKHRYQNGRRNIIIMMG